MTDLAISSAALLTGATIASADLIPVLDVSAAVGSKGSQITVAELFTGRTLLNGAATGLTSLGIRSTGAAYDLTLATSEALSAGRTLSFNVGNADRTLTIPATGTAALLGTENNFSAAQTISVAGAAAKPALRFSGAWLTTTASAVAQLLIQQSGATAFSGSVNGTGLAINAASGFAGNLLDLQVNSTSVFRVSGVGDGEVSAVNGLYTLGASVATGFQVWASYPIRWSTSNSTYLYGGVADTLEMRNGTRGQTLRVSGTFTDASNYVRASLSATSTTVTLAAETAGTGADDIDITLTPAGTGTLKFGTHSAVAAEVVTGYITIKDSGGTTRKLAVIS